MIAFAYGLLRILFVLALVRLVLRGLAAVFRPSGPAQADVEMVRDPVCNTFLPRERALRTTLAGREAYFCSPACRDKARAVAG